MTPGDPKSSDVISEKFFESRASRVGKQSVNKLYRASRIFSWCDKKPPMEFDNVSSLAQRLDELSEKLSFAVQTLSLRDSL